MHMEVDIARHDLAAGEVHTDLAGRGLSRGLTSGRSDRGGYGLRLGVWADRGDAVAMKLDPKRVAATVQGIANETAAMTGS